MRPPQTSISGDEFDTLPPALRRKYFSSLERLRLAQDGPFPSHHFSHRPRSRSNTTVQNWSKPLSTDLDRRLKSIAPTVRHRITERIPVIRKVTVDPETVALYASLPSTVQRKLFSREEQVLLASDRHAVILDAADEVFSRRREQGPYLDGDIDLSDHSHPYHIAGNHFRELPLSASSINMSVQNYSMDSFRWLEDDEELDLSLDDYHTGIAHLDNRQKINPKRRSLRHNLSLSTGTLRRTSLTSPSSGKMLSRSNTPSMIFNFTRPTSAISLQHRVKTSVSSIDPQAAHYQDPAARMKLRLYLASASKFDEAIEFGFPSKQEQPSLDKLHKRTSPRTTNDSGRTFFTGDTPSLSGDDGDDGDELDAIHDPRTPDESVFRENRRSRYFNEKPVVRPRFSRGRTDYSQTSALDREMTLHMTLTRPDLRSPEESSIKLPNVNALPLEQPDLQVNSLMSIWDTLPPVEDSKVKKLFKRLKLK